MNVVARVLITAIVVAAGLRATANAALAALDFPKRLSVSFTEPQMVNLGRRVQHGENLYPDWKTFPYVVNVFTPGYFWLVGLLGKATGAGLEGLQSIGRGTTILFSLLGAALVGWSVHRHGRLAMVAAGCLALGSGVAIKFGWMVRPDLAADVLGFAGFLAATSSAPFWLAAALLAAGILCKQTAVLYLVAATLALCWQGKGRRAAATFASAIAVTGFVLGATFIAGERRVFTDILLEGSSPWRWDHWSTIADRLLRRSAEVVVVSALGFVLWVNSLRSGKPETVADAKRWLSLLMIALAIGGIGSAKFGSDVNYYLPLRLVAAAAIAEIVGRVRSSKFDFAATSAAVVSIPVVLLWILPAVNLVRTHEALHPLVRSMMNAHTREVLGVAELGKAKRVFTNNDDAALRIDNPFVDSFVFKMLVDTGRLQPTVLVERLKRGEYDLVVTTAEVNDPNYMASAFGMPKEVAEAIISRYELSSKGMLFYYRPK